MRALFNSVELTLTKSIRHVFSLWLQTRARSAYGRAYLAGKRTTSAVGCGADMAKRIAAWFAFDMAAAWCGWWAACRRQSLVRRKAIRAALCPKADDANRRSPWVSGVSANEFKGSI